MSSPEKTKSPQPCKSRGLLAVEATPPTILLIEDNGDLLFVQKLLLETADFNVVTAQSGAAALAALIKIAQPDLILLDMELGDMMGTDLLRKLESERPDIIEHVPVVFLTGRHEVPESRAAGMIRKPLEVNEFVREVRRFIEMGNHSPYKH